MKLKINFQGQTRLTVKGNHTNSQSTPSKSSQFGFIIKEDRNTNLENAIMFTTSPTILQITELFQAQSKLEHPSLLIYYLEALTLSQHKAGTTGLTINTKQHN